jgi:peroxiredoxin family protein
MAADLLILAHGQTWDMRFQVSSLAASAAAVGEGVAIALYFGALAAWARKGGWDSLDPAPPVSAARLASLDMPPLSSMLAGGREAGLIRVYACSASVRVLGLEMAEVQALVDAVLGWQSFSRMTATAGRVVTL